jgi:hypothetical protein
MSRPESIFNPACVGCNSWNERLSRSRPGLSFPALSAITAFPRVHVPGEWWSRGLFWAWRVDSVSRAKPLSSIVLTRWH